jgi:hypothetical protein
MLARATSIKAVSELMPVRFFALVTRASGILPRTTWVRSPRRSPSLSAMTITSRNLLECVGLFSPMAAWFFLCEELGWATRFRTHLLENGCIIFLRSTMLWLLRHIISESSDCTFTATAESHSKQKVVTSNALCLVSPKRLVISVNKSLGSLASDSLKWVENPHVELPKISLVPGSNN